MYPKVAGLHKHLGDIYRQQGKYAAAIAEYQQLIDLSGRENVTATAKLAIVHAGTGNRSETLRLLEAARQSPEPDAPFCIAAIYSALGDKKQALAWLDKSFGRVIHTCTN